MLSELIKLTHNDVQNAPNNDENQQNSRHIRMVGIGRNEERLFRLEKVVGIALRDHKNTVDAIQHKN